jgi:hypothetical protein
MTKTERAIRIEIAQQHLRRALSILTGALKSNNEDDRRHLWLAVGEATANAECVVKNLDALDTED